MRRSRAEGSASEKVGRRFPPQKGEGGCVHRGVAETATAKVGRRYGRNGVGKAGRKSVSKELQQTQRDFPPRVRDRPVHGRSVAMNGPLASNLAAGGRTPSRAREQKPGPE
eukprot:7159705-Pyramimonas_sp.AAC.1